jgi:hypothetical protein
MGFSETVAEIARRNVTGDTWFVQEHPYVLVLTCLKPGGIPNAVSVFVLPRGPQAYTTTRVFRQSVTPTVGGLVAEERGALWREITVVGSFGLEPKTTEDTSAAPEPPNTSGLALSGPMWTRRMLRNFFDKYAELKADPEFASVTTLEWHDIKLDEHFVVVPLSVDIARTSEKRMQYPYTLKLRAVAEAGRIILPEPASGLLAAIKDVIANVSAALTLIASAIQEGSEILGEVRYFVATIDGILTDLDTIVNSAQDFVDGVTDTISVGRVFITSTATLLEDALALMESAEGLPVEVRQNYQDALDGLHTVAAQAAAFGTTYAQEIAAVAAAEAGAGGDDAEVLGASAESGPSTSTGDFAARTIRSTDQARVGAGAVPMGRPFGVYAGFRDYTLTAVDTLPSIAARLLGDGALWYDLAIFNRLKPPYTSPSGIPGTVRPGDVIIVPIVGGANAGAVVSGSNAPDEDLLGTDVMLDEFEDSSPGRPVVDIAIDRRTLRDVRSIVGVPNLVQALQMRLWTERGHMPLVPGYGLSRVVGFGSTAANASALQVSVRGTVLDDSRVQSVSRLTIKAEGDTIEIEADVLPIGATTAQSVNAALA